MLRAARIAAFGMLWVVLAGCARPVAPMQVAAVTTAPPPFPVPIVELHGSADAIGAAHGERLGEPIRGLMHDYLGQYFESDFQRNIALYVAAGFERFLAPEHLAEVRAMAGGAGVQQREAMLGQCFLDLSAMTACSTVALPAAAAPDGVARFGRNLDFPSFNIVDDGSVLLIVRGDGGRYGYASVAWPGVLGVLSGMNEHGLTLANMEVQRPRLLPMAMPYTLLYRTVLERCRTVEEAIALLEKTPRQTANNLMLMDATGNRAVVEITPQSVTVRRAPADAALISTNHQRGDDMDSSGYCPRYDLLHDESADAFGAVSVEKLEQMLGAAAQGRKTLQSMVFEPSNRVIYLAVGANAPTKGYHRLELKKYFAGPS